MVCYANDKSNNIEGVTRIRAMAGIATQTQVKRYCRCDVHPRDGRKVIATQTKQWFCYANDKSNNIDGEVHPRDGGKVIATQTKLLNGLLCKQ